MAIQRRERGKVGGVAEDVGRGHLEFVDVEIRTEKAVEKHQRGYAGVGQLLDHQPQIGKVIADLERDRNRDRFLNLFDDLEIDFFFFLAGTLEFRGEEKHVQL